jgi:hypothetical protein
MIILKCISSASDTSTNALSYRQLTIGKNYELDKIGMQRDIEDSMVGSYSSFYIKGDDNTYSYFSKSCFTTIDELREQKLNQLGI